MRLGVLVRVARKAGGAFLIATAYLPIHHLLSPDRAGPAGAATVSIADADLGLLQAGTLVALLVGLLLATIVPKPLVSRFLTRVGERIRAPSRGAWGTGVFALSLFLALASALGLHRGLPRLFDEMVQLLHARVFASGALTLPVPDPAAAFLVQNSVLTPTGWASIYPPGHTLLLAAGMLANLEWAVGPTLLAFTTLLTFLVLDRLCRPGSATVRLASLAVAVSPFMILLGSGYLSHVSAAASAALAFWATVEAWKGKAAWALLSGAALGFMVTSRPWIGLALGGSLVVGTWVWVWWHEGRSVGWLGVRLGSGALGGLPFAAGLLTYGHRVFGSATRLGYEVAFGPSHGLGFHTDPWGNVYGLREALGYTAADLSTLGLRLLETPVSIVGLVGLFLLLAPRLSFAARLLLLWALIPVAANAFYWHHGQHMGPRMLFEAGPGWLALAVVATAGLVRGAVDPNLPEEAAGPPGSSLPDRVAFWTVATAVVASATTLAPSRLGGEGWSADGLARSTLPALEAGGSAPTIVFVHGTWANRVASRLAAMGMRRDSVETALRQNDLCRVHLYADARARGAEPLPALDLEPRPGTPPGLTAVETPGGVRVRLESEDLPPECLRELRSDRYGVLELAPLLWQLPFPGVDPKVMLARDLGPEGNGPLVEAHADARMMLLGMTREGDLPELLPYQDAMRELWGNTP